MPFVPVFPWSSSFLWSGAGIPAPGSGRPRTACARAAPSPILRGRAALVCVGQLLKEVQPCPRVRKAREWGNVFRHVPHRFIPARRLEGFCGRESPADSEPSIAGRNRKGRRSLRIWSFRLSPEAEWNRLLLTQSRGDPSVGVSWQSVGGISPQKLCIPG